MKRLSLSAPEVVDFNIRGENSDDIFVKVIFPFVNKLWVSQSNKVLMDILFTDHKRSVRWLLYRQRGVKECCSAIPV